MSVEIQFWAGEESFVNDLEGYGLGFYGASGFGASVEVGDYQGRTWITNGAGTYEGPEANNCKRASTTGVISGQSGGAILLTALPNYLATLNIRVVSDTSIKLQNTTVRIYDRNNITNPPTGVTCFVADIVHPATTQTNVGSGSSTWHVASPTGSAALTLIASPGTSGFRPSGSNTYSLRHDHYIALSASPDSIGSKTLFGLYYTTEYL